MIDENDIDILPLRSEAESSPDRSRTRWDPDRSGES